MLTIANTGIDKTLDKELLFARFASQSKQQESTGLGLAIVKSIVDLYSIRIDYQYAMVCIHSHYYSINGRNSQFFPKCILFFAV